jgi:hypothetical protein
MGTMDMRSATPHGPFYAKGRYCSSAVERRTATSDSAKHLSPQLNKAFDNLGRAY